MKTIVFIIGTGHCGSTLLDLILGSHSMAQSLGEVHRVVGNYPEELTCGICDRDCTIWSKDLIANLRDAYKSNGFFKLQRRLGLLDAKEMLFYKTLFKVTNKEVLIDSSKNIHWVEKNYMALKKAKYKLMLVYLSRDGRAVINSYNRKYPQRGLINIANNWNKRIAKINACVDSWPINSRIHLKYEELTKEPTKTIQQLVKFLDMPFENEIMNFWNFDHHIINGNAGTRSMILKFRNDNQFEKSVSEKSKNYYKAHELGIRYDDRWKKELTEKELDQINMIIENTNESIKERI